MQKGCGNFYFLTKTFLAMLYIFFVKQIMITEK